MSLPAPISPFERFLSDYAAAVFAKDVPAFLALYAPDATIFDSWDRWRHEREEWARMAVEWLGGLGDERVRVTALDVTPWTDETLAGGAATLEFAALDPQGAVLRALRNRLSVVLRREAGSDVWRVAHQHTSVPVDFESQRMLWS